VEVEEVWRGVEGEEQRGAQVEEWRNQRAKGLRRSYIKE